MRSRILVAAIAALALLGTPGVASADDPVYDPTSEIPFDRMIDFILANLP